MPPLWEYELVTAPADNAAVCTLAQAKVACGVLHDDHDGLLQDLIDSAVSVLDGPFGFLGQAIGEQTWTVRCGPAGLARVLAMPLGPVTAVTAIKTHDGTTLTTQTLGDFRVLYSRFNTTVEPVSGAWPAMGDREDALQITLAVGAAAVSPAIKQAVRGLVAHWYSNRGTVLVGTVSKEIEFGLQATLVNERRF